MDLNQSRLLEIAEKYHTPLYVYDAETILRQIENLQSFFPIPEFHIHFAIKALTNRNILKLINKAGCGLDTVSIEEMKIALSSGVEASDINFTPSGADRDEYLFAIEHGIGLHVDNLDMLSFIAERKPGAEVILRFNPAIRAGAHHQLEVGDEDSKFGLNDPETHEIEKEVNRLGVKVVGVHIHVGSDISTVDKYFDAFEFLLRRAEQFSTHLRYINFGGGYKVAYKEGDHATNMELLGKKITEKFKSFQEKHHQPLQLIMEPGKYLVGKSGVFLTRVTTVKHFRRRSIAYVNSGFNHLIRPMYYGAYHRIENISKPHGELKHYNVVGYLCETDTFASDREIRDVQPNDILAFSNAGAYCYMMASNYNSRIRPAEVLFSGGQDHLIRRREKLEDILQTEIIIDL